MKTSRVIFASVVVSAVTAISSVMLYNHYFAQQPTVQVEQIAPTHFASLPASRSNSQPIDFRYAAASATPSVVHIQSTFNKQQVSMRGRDPLQEMFGDNFQYFFHGQSPYQHQPQVASGSGVIVSNDGYIVTNNHVVENADVLEVILANKKKYKAKLVGRDADTDLALLKIEADDLPAVQFANSDSVLIGEWVLAVGNPFNLESTVTAGIVSAKGRNINLLGEQNQRASNTTIESFIQTDAAVNPGNSGGALVNVNGELVGINTAIASPTGSYAGYSFAVPANMVNKVVLDLKEFGVTQRGYLGVTIRSVDDKTAEDLNMSSPMGVYIDAVNKGSSGEAAGLKQRDVITKINGVSVNSAPELQEQVAKYRPADKITVEYLRDGKTQTTSVILKNKYNTTAQVDNSRDILNELGISIENLTAAEARAMGVEGGVKVTDIRTGKISTYANIRKGFVITQVDDELVRNSEDFLNILKNKSDKVMVEGMYPRDPRNYLFAFRMK